MSEEDYIDTETIKSNFIEPGMILNRVNKDGSKTMFEVKKINWDCKSPPKITLLNIETDMLHGPFFWGKLVDEIWEIHYGH